MQLQKLTKNAIKSPWHKLHYSKIMSHTWYTSFLFNESAVQTASNTMPLIKGVLFSMSNQQWTIAMAWKSEMPQDPFLMHHIARFIGFHILKYDLSGQHEVLHILQQHRSTKSCIPSNLDQKTVFWEFSSCDVFKSDTKRHVAMD